MLKFKLGCYTSAPRSPSREPRARGEEEETEGRGEAVSREEKEGQGGEGEREPGTGEAWQAAYPNARAGVLGLGGGRG